MAKCINTLVLARFFAAHPRINVHSNAIPENPNSSLREKLSFLGLPAPLFTIDMQQVPRVAFQRFFDSLEPMFSHMISLGQSNTIVSCPALTTHSELSEAALAESGISPTTIRFAVGDEDPLDLINHFIASAKLTIDPIVPGFSDGFMPRNEIEQLLKDCYLKTHQRYIESRCTSVTD